MRRILLALVAVGLMGCSSGGGKSIDSKGGSNEGFKVALLTPGPVNDSGWSAMAYEGLVAIRDELGAEISNQEARGTQIRDAMRSYAQRGFRLVIGHGFEYNEPGVELAMDFPDTVFVSSSGGKTSANAGAFRFYLEQGFYLAGAMAADLSKSGVLAMIGGPKVPSIESTFKAFEAGAKATRPSVRVITLFTGQDSDVAAAKRATLEAISQGADVVIHQANAAAQGVFEACREKGVLAIGSNANQNDNESGVVVGSAVIVAKPAFVELAREVKEGRYQGSIRLIGMEKGAIDFVLNPKLESRVPEAVKQKLAGLKEKILSGELIVPKDEF
ncbi:MAG: BMP family protein [Fimbriimonadales bacterium]|nr:BMP family protein [Fimbriimonadales bacterium]